MEFISKTSPEDTACRAGSAEVLQEKIKDGGLVGDTDLEEAAGKLTVALIVQRDHVE